MKPNLFHGIILILAAGAGLFFLKYTVEQEEVRLAAMKAQYLEDQKALKVLKAEWTYLNSPQYLQDLTRKYLTVRPMASAQVASWADDIPGQHQPLTPIAYASKYSPGPAREVALSTPLPLPGSGDEP